MRISDWSSDVCSSDLLTTQFFAMKIQRYMSLHGITPRMLGAVAEKAFANGVLADHAWRREAVDIDTILHSQMVSDPLTKFMFCSPGEGAVALLLASRSEEHTSELQSLMRISYAVFCLKKKKQIDATD